MTGVEFLKIIGLVLITLVVGLVQVTFTVIEVNGITPNLVLILVFGVSFLKVKKSSEPGWRSYSVALSGGLLLDIFSGLPLGTEALMLIMTVMVIERVLQFLGKVNFLVFTVLFALLLVLYQLIFNFAALGTFALNWVGLIYNLSLAILFYSLCFLGTILREK